MDILLDCHKKLHGEYNDIPEPPKRTGQDSEWKAHLSFPHHNKRIERILNLDARLRWSMLAGWVR